MTDKAGSGFRPIATRMVIRFVFTAVLTLAILFVAAGTLKWWVAWAYVAVTLAVLGVSRVLMIRKNPDLAIERAQAGAQEDTKSWDRGLVPVVAVYGPIVSWVVAGLDHRFGWSPPTPLGVQLVALFVLVAGSSISTWAMVENRFFSSHVRIQTDRGHSVVDTGPYRIVRHPGYAGGVLSWVAAPFFFGSWWVAVPTLLVIAAMLVRTALEDRTLQEELAGYKEYAKRVRYRLLPGVW
jgi:protein-S-isoprenylcysteine O-methyltransferase Ste14